MAHSGRGVPSCQEETKFGSVFNQLIFHSADSAAYHRAMINFVWVEALRKRGCRWEPKWLGDIDADSLDVARRIAAERWLGIRLSVDEQRIMHHSTPKTGYPPKS
jgi:hypothetical protein